MLLNTHRYVIIMLAHLGGFNRFWITIYEELSLHLTYWSDLTIQGGQLLNSPQVREQATGDLLAFISMKKIPFVKVKVF